MATRRSNNFLLSFCFASTILRDCVRVGECFVSLLYLSFVYGSTLDFSPPISFFSFFFALATAVHLSIYIARCIQLLLSTCGVRNRVERESKRRRFTKLLVLTFFLALYFYPVLSPSSSHLENNNNTNNKGEKKNGSPFLILHRCCSSYSLCH